jgi:CheY-like chemotaxis protein
LQCFHCAYAVFPSRVSEAASLYVNFGSLPTRKNPSPFSAFIGLIDGFDADRKYLADRLKHCSLDYQILEAVDGRSGLEVCKSRQVDCVVLEITLQDLSGLEVLMTLVPRASKPRIAVIVLTQLSYRGIWELAKEHGAYVCFVKQHTTSEDLYRAIQRAVTLVGQLPKEDRYRPILAPPPIH